MRSTKITLPLKWQLKSSGHQIIIEAGETGLFSAAVNFVCVCERERETHQGYAGAQLNLKPHWQTYCTNEMPVSQRGQCETRSVGGRRAGDPNSTQQHLIRIITPGEHGRGRKQWGERGHGHMLLTLSHTDRAHSSKTREQQLHASPRLPQTFHTHTQSPLSPINGACVWYVCMWKTELVMSAQLRNISALLGDVIIHLWGCQERRLGTGRQGGWLTRTEVWARGADWGKWDSMTAASFSAEVMS